MADYTNVNEQGVRYADKGSQATGNLTWDLSDHNLVKITKTGNGGNLTISGGGAHPNKVTLIIEQDGTGTRLKPVLVFGANDAGTTIVFHTAGTGGTGGALPTLSTTAGVVDVFNFVSPDGVNYYLSSFQLGNDEA